VSCGTAAIGSKANEHDDLLMCLSLNHRELREPTSPIISYRFYWTTPQGFLASGELGFVLGLLTDIGISVLERAGEVVGRSVAADITIDAGRVDIKRAVNALFDFVVWVRHESADYADFTD
jgi:hypothetical protein